MRTLDKYFAIINEGQPFLNIDTDLEVWRKAEEIMTISRPNGEVDINPAILATEKFLLRALISYLTKFQPAEEHTFSNIAFLLRTSFDKIDNDKTALDDLMESVDSDEEDIFCCQQYKFAKLIDEYFKIAVINLTDRITIFEILEKDKDVYKKKYSDSAIIA